MMEFSEQLRRAREVKGFTQKSLAEQLYVSRQSISNWECGERYPDLVTLKKISCILDVSLDNLLSGKEMVKVVEKKPVIENKIINGIIAALYAFIVLSLFLKVGEEFAMHYVHAYKRFTSDSVGLFGVDAFFHPDREYLLEQIVLLFTFSYGLYNAIRDKLTPKKVGIILMEFFSSYLIFHVAVMAFLNKGYSEFFRIFVLEGSDVFFYIKVMLENLIMPAAIGIMGVIASYYCFIRGKEHKFWFNMITVGSVLAIINKFICIFKQLSVEKFIIINYSTATFESAVITVKAIVEGAVLPIAIYVLIIYQAHVLYRKRKIAQELSDEQGRCGVVY